MASTISVAQAKGIYYFVLATTSLGTGLRKLPILKSFLKQNNESTGLPLVWEAELTFVLPLTSMVQ